jgi:predicted MPP superfamily phosphohydrolase
VLPVALAIAAFAAGCVVYGVVVERSWYRVVRHRLNILPTDGPPTLTLLHLSDLHFVRADDRKARFLSTLPTPDVTIVTGDFLAEPEGIPAAVEAVRAVRGRLGSWFVLGSNDYFVPQPKNYFDYFRESRRRRRVRRGKAHDLVHELLTDGWEDLSNTRRLLSLDGLAVELLGLDDAHIGRHDLRVAPRRDTDRFGIALMHSPDSAAEAAALGYELVLAGHTHGGQVRLPFVGALVTNSDMPRRLVAGPIRLGTALLHTSPGLGTGKYAPFRFWCRPEATILELGRRTSR